MQQQWTFLNWIVTCENSRIYMATDDDQLSGWTEKKLQSTSQSQTYAKNWSWSLFGGLLFIWSSTFWISAKPLHLRSMLSKLIRCTENLLLALANRKGPFLLHNDAWTHVTQQMLQTLKKLEYKVLPHPPYLFWPLANFFKCLDNFFLREIASTASKRQKMLSKTSSNPEAHIFFMLQELNKAISCCKNLLIAMVPILINKDVFEPSYNNLEFMIWNHNYVCTNIISSLLSYKGGATKYYFLNCLT